MKDLYTPDNSVELSLIKSIFDGEGIHYYVFNDHFGSLYIGPQIDLYNAKVIRVHEMHFEKAKEILSDFLQRSQNDVEPEPTVYSLWDKIRMFLEMVFFVWFVPGKKKRLSETRQGELAEANDDGNKKSA